MRSSYVGRRADLVAVFFFQAEDGIRDDLVMEFRRVLFRSIFADFSQFLPEGRTDLPQYRKDWTAYIEEGNRVQKVEISDMHIQVSPNKDTAVASYILHVRTKLKDRKVTDEDNQESDVMFKRKGEWKVVFLHYSNAPKK